MFEGNDPTERTALIMESGMWGEEGLLKPRL